MVRALLTLPCYNEEAVLVGSVGALLGYCNERLSSYDWSILIADNASTDGTGLLGEALASGSPRVGYFRLEEKGRGRILKACWSSFDSDIYAYMDADLATGLEFVPALLGAIRDGADLASGCRLGKGARVLNRSVVREVVSRSYNVLIRKAFGIQMRDTQCGFKAIGRRCRDAVLPRVQDGHWFFDTEAVVLSLKSGLKVAEIPITWEDRGERGSRVKLFRDILFFTRKIRELRRRLK